MKWGLIIVLASSLVAVACPARGEGGSDTCPGERGTGTPPLIRGALWWFTSEYAELTEDDFEKAIQAQCDVGFDTLWIFNTPTMLAAAERGDSNQASHLEAIYKIADAKGMRIIADLPQGGWYGKATKEEILAVNRDHIARYAARYGEHSSFWGWYLNYEINPIKPDDTEQTAFWRELWRDIVDACHGAAPESVVTISPFFLLDDGTRRGFYYQSPEEYAGWWGATMKAAGIDILMLQDSGEHLSFFTLEQREPFFAAVAKACHDAGAKFWVNVETGEAHVADWEEYLALSKEKKVPWRFTPIDWLEKKLELAARHGDGIINWGYFPFMDPMGLPVTSGERGVVTGATPPEAYQDYKAYYIRVKERRAVAEINKHLADIKEIHARIAPELERIMPAKIRVEPELAKLGEEVHLDFEVAAERSPNPSLRIYVNHLANAMEKKREITLSWQRSGARHGLGVFTASHRFLPDATGNYLAHWTCDVGGDIPEFWRSFGVIDEASAVCLFQSTSHTTPRPEEDFHRAKVPFDYWDTGSLVLHQFVDSPHAETWAKASREARQFGSQATPMLFSDYFLRERERESHFAQASEDLQRTVLSAYREFWPLLGFDGPMACLAAYSQGNGPIRSARSLEYETIAALCSGQNWQDGSFTINHSGMPDRPYFISREDFRKAGDGGPAGLVGIPQCQRNTFLCHDYGCTYCLEPAWNEFFNSGGGRRVLDEIHMSRQYDFFEAMLQNRLSQNQPYFFTVGIEFNGVAPGITESNRMFIEYAVGKAASVPLVFSTGPAVTDYFRRHYTETPESTCYQPDFFCGQTNLGKPASYPDTMEIEGPHFKALFQAPDLLPHFHYDYGVLWDCPDWGNESLPRNAHGYLTPGTYDRFKAVPPIVDTRRFRVARSDAPQGQGFAVTVKVTAEKAQRNLTLALWDIPRRWRPGNGWWSVSENARFVPVRAPFTETLNGILVADVQEGENTFVVTVNSPARAAETTTVKVDELIEGRVYARDGQVTAYLWATQPQGATLALSLPAGKTAFAYVPPEGEPEECGEEVRRFALPKGKWLRITGLAANEIRDFCRAEPLEAVSQ